MAADRSGCISDRGRYSVTHVTVFTHVRRHTHTRAPDDDGGAYGHFGIKLGAGAAKLGKKAAQSEAGRSAGRAAVAGATEGVKQDLTNRYFGDDSAGAPALAPPSSSSSQKQPQTSASSSSSGKAPSSSQSHSSSTKAASYSQTTREPRPPKPSLLSRFKPHVGKTPKKSQRRPVRQRQSHEKGRVYKYSLSKEADWEKELLVQALFNFKGEMRCDLEFRKGQVIQVLTRTYNQFDWWEGKLEDCVGIFPANYVKMM